MQSRVEQRRRPMRWLWVVVFPLACGTSNAAQRSDVEALAREVRDQRERQQTMERRMADLDTRLSMMAERQSRDSPRPTDGQGRPTTPVAADMARPNLGVVRVEPKVGRKPTPRPEPTQSDDDAEAVVELGPQEQAALEAGGQERLPVDRAVLAESPGEDGEGTDAQAEQQTVARTDPKGQYQASMKQYQAKQYARAARGFEDVADRWPDHPLADNALYWTGVCYLSQGEAALAINEFQKLPVRYPKSDKVPDALFQLGEAYQKVGDVESAKAMLTQVVKMYPHSEAAGPARERLAKLGLH